MAVTWRWQKLHPNVYDYHSLFFCVLFFTLCCSGVYNLIWSLQAVITEINENIGTTGVVSQECKTVVSQYGQQILDLLLAEVCIFQTMDLFFLIAGLINCSWSSVVTQLAIGLFCRHNQRRSVLRLVCALLMALMVLGEYCKQCL